MDPVLARIAAYMHDEHAPAPGERVLAMVSGGPDSVCMMHALAALHDGPVGVLTVDHGLRPDAADEVRHVALLAARLGLPCRSVQLGLVRGAAVQARARAARYGAARAVAAADGWDVIAVGHTASDQAETVLMRLARGAGRTGALGMAPRRGNLIRPLLGVTADETAAWCDRSGIAVAMDPSNEDPAFTRVRARALMTAFSDLHPGAERHVAAFADLLRDEHAIIGPAVDAAWERCARGSGLDIRALRDEPPALQRLVVRRLCTEAGLGGDGLNAAAVARILDVGAGVPRTEVPGGAIVAEAGRLVVLTVTPSPPAPERLAVPGVVRFGDATIRGRHGIGAPPTPDRVTIPPGGVIEVRGPHDGDRIALPGGGHARVGRILQSDGVPARLRPRVPVVVVDQVPVWVAGHRASAGALAEPGAPAVVLEVVPA
jgi:tRNA(Ile)-lysidine synthase